MLDRGLRPGAAIGDVAVAAERVAVAAQAAHALTEPLVLTARAESHLHGVDDIDDTVARLLAYREAGADVVYAPGLTDLRTDRAVVESVGLPVNVSRCRTGRRSRSSRRSAFAASRPAARWLGPPTERCSAPRRSSRTPERPPTQGGEECWGPKVPGDTR